MATYSYGSGTTQATKLNDLPSVLNVLPDNTSKLISPRDVRDSIFTTWENITFKPTTAGGDEYIGIDRDTFQEKILFGKKKVSGQYVMTSDLLNTDVDIFFYNTRSEPFSSPGSTTNYDTTVAFLAGTGSMASSTYIYAPYLKSSVVVNPGYDNSIDFEIKNTSRYTIGLTSYGGNISIESENGHVNINGIQFPTKSNYINTSAYEGYVLKYRDLSGIPTAVWEEIGTQSTTALFSTGTVSITGNPVLLNGQNINFSSSIPVPNTVGGITSGMTFSDVPVTEMIRMLLYPYIGPTITSSVNASIVEAGNTASANIIFNWSINKTGTYSINTLSFGPGSYTPALPLSISTNGTTTGSLTTNHLITSAGIYLLGTSSYASVTFTMSIADTKPTSQSTSQTVNVVIPWYWGSATISCTQSSGPGNINNILGTASNIVGKLNPLLTQPALSSNSIYNKTLTLKGNGVYLYFGYPSNFPDITQIIDPNGFDVTSQFSKFTISGITSPLFRWSNKTYKFYIYVGPGGGSPVTTTIGNPGNNYTGNYQFKFA